MTAFRLPKQAPGVDRNAHRRAKAMAGVHFTVRPSFLPLLALLL